MAVAIARVFLNRCPEKTGGWAVVVEEEEEEEFIESTEHQLMLISPCPFPPSHSTQGAS